jgi:hypothetical protein
MREIADKLSRRTLLRNAAAVVGVAGTSAFAASCQPLAPPPPVAQPAPPPPRFIRQTKLQAAYQDVPRGVQRCGVCVHFRPPNDCETIEGPVQPNGWCRNFVPRTPGPERG